ncbi:MAG: amino acid ABC transporter substrate-binding protein [Caldilineaceae bacterium]|nr:amino acid ABC transporter substrate-binding protein [Caldilineaceae bacterium]
MFKRSKIYVFGMIMSMVVGMVIAACFGAAPAPAEAEPEPAASEAAVAETAPAESAAQTGGSTLQTVLDRGYIICVGNANLPGFGFIDEAGEFSGFDVDFCKAYAAAIFGDATKFEIRAATASERFTVLQSGEADVLVRNTTETMSRDTDLGGNFAPVTFYDGQGLIVRKADGFTTLQDLNGGSICVQAGTTTELNLADQMAAAGVEYEPVVYETADETSNAYEEGRCDAFTTDKSGLVSRQSIMAEPDAHVIMDVTLSKEPLGPMVRHGDDQWYDIIKWSTYVTFLAEEAGINMENVDSFLGSEDPNIRKLLGDEGEFGAKVGLSNDWAYQIIKQVGNYADIYNRNLGPDTVFDLPRGLNAGYWDGGILYAPPIR